TPGWARSSADAAPRTHDGPGAIRPGAVVQPCGRSAADLGLAAHRELDAVAAGGAEVLVRGAGPGLPVQVVAGRAAPGLARVPEGVELGVVAVVLRAGAAAEVRARVGAPVGHA